MKKKILLVALLMSFEFISNLNAQNLEGNYSVTGYFFHPTSSRGIALKKTITQIGVSTYKIVVLGDLYNWAFKFSVDSNNHLTNWVAAGLTYPAPASGFMTSDNPGGFTFPGNTSPGTSPWLQSTYNNTYDPATKTFYMHYGYDSLANNQNGYDRQVYEKYTLIIQPRVTAANPLNGTSGTRVVITGRNFSLVDPSATVRFGYTLADTAWVISNTKIIAKVAAGSSGTVSVKDSSYALPGFVYTPPATVTNPGWSYVGPAGFSQNRVTYVSAVSGSNNVPYVAFVDSLTGRTQVTKYFNGKWSAVGSYVSDIASYNTDIVLTKTNTPVVAFVNKKAGDGVTVKKLKSGYWIGLGKDSFAYATSFSLALDSSDVPYLAISAYDTINVYKLQNNVWTIVGRKNIARAFDYAGYNITVDKKLNIPYLIFQSKIDRQAYVIKFDGSTWDTVGSVITSGRAGAYYNDVEVDTLGNVFASMQDDNGFERQSVYEFINNKWVPVGSPRFSNGRSYDNELAFDGRNNPYVLFTDGSFNKSGSVMKFDRNSNKWNLVGSRGFINFSDLFQRHSLMFDTANNPMVAFADLEHGGRISVMKLDDENKLLTDNLQSGINICAQTFLDFSIFPNPVNTILNIKLNSISKNLSIQIINVKGIIVLQKAIDASNTDIININVSNLPVGTYTCSVKNANKLISHQFLKQ